MSKLERIVHDDSNGLDYILVGEIYLPLIAVPEEKRDARFVCVIACAYPDGNVITTKGVIEGKLAHEPKGTHGFGYDPIFYLPERGCTTGELLPEEKNKISHRGIALRKMVEKLNEQA